MDSLNLPPAVRAYFEADRSGDAEAFVAAFALDAIVHDEGATRTGHDEIKAWWLAAKEKYAAKAEPLEATRYGEAVSVRALVSGNFPGSPATLTFTFRIVDDRIGALEIG